MAEATTLSLVADLLVYIVVGGAKVVTGVKIAAGQTTGSTVAFAELGFIARGTPVTLDVTQVGPNFPGERLVGECEVLSGRFLS